MSDKVDFKTGSIIRDKGTFHNNKMVNQEDIIPSTYANNSITSKCMKQKLKLDLIELRR